MALQECTTAWLFGGVLRAVLKLRSNPDLQFAETRKAGGGAAVYGWRSPEVRFEPSSTMRLHGGLPKFAKENIIYT